MLYSLLLSIGSFITLVFLAITYFVSLKKLNKIEFRQRIYMILMTVGLISILMDILEGIFYSYELTIPYYMSWKTHWLTSYSFYFLTYYYFYLYFNIDKIENYKEIFIGKKMLSIKNILLLFMSIIIMLIMIYIKPFEYGQTFEFIPTKYILFTIISIAIYFVFFLDLIIKYVKKEKNKQKLKNDLIIMLVIVISIAATVIIQMTIRTFAFLGIGMYLGVLLVYFLIENVDIIVANELKILQKNIEKSSNAKLDFLYNMSHDIRSPMNAIVELSKSLSKIDNFDETIIKNDIKNIKFSCNNLVDIINNILDVNKIASGKETVQLKEYNLNSLLADIPYVIETRIGSRPIKLEFEIDQNIASKLLGDTTKIYRVIMNILTNSVKYTEVGKIKMTINGKVDGSFQILNIKISDTGYGIKKEDYDKLFTKFNRLEDATDNSIEGTGLGLVITKKYVDSMDGKIWFESEYGAGTVFYIELPQKIIDNTPLSKETEMVETKKIEITDCSHSKVLVVDDNELNIKVTKKLLEKYNIEVDTVKNGDECLYKIKSDIHYDLILLDDMLPDLGGMEIIKVLKNIEGFDIPPVIAYTANVMNGIKDDYIKAGFDDYMSKPLDIHQFDSIVKKYCYKQKN